MESELYARFVICSDWKSVSNTFHSSTKNASQLLESNEYYSQKSKDFVSERNESPTLSTDEMETIDKKSVEETIPSFILFSYLTLEFHRFLILLLCIQVIMNWRIMSR